MDIARMSEVELVSEFMMAMLSNAILGKSQKNIDNFYKKYEESEFQEGKEISRRFRAVMDTIEDKFNIEKPQSILTQHTLFYSLLILLYDLQFSFVSLDKSSTKLKQISKKEVAKIEELGNCIAQGNVPTEILTAYQKNTTNLKSRTTLFNYFKEKIR